MREKKVQCETCPAEFMAEVDEWAVLKEDVFQAVNNVSRRASGYDGERWFWMDQRTGDNVYPSAEMYYLEEEILRSPSFGGLLRCPACMDARIAAEEHISELMTPGPASWFDPAVAGERWDDDY